MTSLSPVISTADVSWLRGRKRTQTCSSCNSSSRLTEDENWEKETIKVARDAWSSKALEDGEWGCGEEA